MQVVHLEFKPIPSDCSFSICIINVCLKKADFFCFYMQIMKLTFYVGHVSCVDSLKISAFGVLQ
jgi:hypothetical protein